MVRLQLPLPRMRKMNPIYQVFERREGETHVKMTTGPYQPDGPRPRSWNDKARIYLTLSQARVYKKRMQAQGRDAVIIKYEPTGEVE